MNLFLLGVDFIFELNKYLYYNRVFNLIVNKL